MSTYMLTSATHSHTHSIEYVVVGRTESIHRFKTTLYAHKHKCIQHYKQVAHKATSSQFTELMRPRWRLEYIVDDVCGKLRRLKTRNKNHCHFWWILNSNVYFFRFSGLITLTRIKNLLYLGWPRVGLLAASPSNMGPKLRPLACFRETSRTLGSTRLKKYRF